MRTEKPLKVLIDVDFDHNCKSMRVKQPKDVSLYIHFTVNSYTIRK